MKKKVILIIDDERELLKAIKIRVEENSYEVITANDGLEGLEKRKTRGQI